MYDFRLKRFVLIAFVVLLSACAALPPSLQTNADPVVTDYSAWQASDDQGGRTVRLGGVVASVRNMATKTRIEVVNLPINSSGQPDLYAEPSGRFIAYVRGFVDPVTMAKGRLVTFLGTSEKPEVGKVGYYTYHFPVMEASGYHLWRVASVVTGHDPFLSPCFGERCRYHHRIKYNQVVLE